MDLDDILYGPDFAKSCREIHVNHIISLDQACNSKEMSVKV
jgi:hypothetical protein